MLYNCIYVVNIFVVGCIAYCYTSFPMKRGTKKLVAFRIRKQVRVALQAIADRSGKTKTRIVEDAILLHAKELA